MSDERTFDEQDIVAFVNQFGKSLVQGGFVAAEVMAVTVRFFLEANGFNDDPSPEVIRRMRSMHDYDYEDARCTISNLCNHVDTRSDAWHESIQHAQGLVEQAKEEQDG